MDLGAWFLDLRLARRRGSALVIVLLLVCVLSVVAGSLLLSASTRYHTTFQSASWQESIVGAEAGIDLAMNELRKRVLQGPGAAFTTNWTTSAPSGSLYTNYGHAFPASNQAYTLSTHAGEGNSVMQARVFLDVPGSSASPVANFAIPPNNANDTFISQVDNPALRDPDGVDRSRWWYRIRALGTAGLSGQPVANIQKLDNELRRFSFYTDWRTGRGVTNPQVSRLVEITAQPLTNFRNALMADKRIDLSNMDVLIDSYDSSKGVYNSTTNHGYMGNIATNGQLINANHATVDGNAMTDNGSVNAGDNVSGQQSSNFYQELTPITNGMLNPAWAGVPDGGTVTTTTDYVASTDATNPTLVRLDGINLPAGGNVISIDAPSSASVTTPSFIKIYVQGDIVTNDDSFINVAAGVNAIVYFTGNVSLVGDGVFNNSLLASRLVLNGLEPPANSDGTYPARSVAISTYQDFEGIVYAPNHDLNLALQVPSAGGSAAGASGGSASGGSSSGGTGLGGTGSGGSGGNSGSGSGGNGNSGSGGGKPVGPGIGDDDDDDNDDGPLGTSPASSGVNSTITSNVAAQIGRLQQRLAQVTSQNNQAKIAQVEAQIASLLGNPTQAQSDDHFRGYNGIYGGFVARTITVAAKTHVHYDETLRQAGPVNHYQIVSWFEDNVSRDATGGVEQYWWTSASR